MLVVVATDVRHGGKLESRIWKAQPEGTRGCDLYPWENVPAGSPKTRACQKREEGPSTRRDTPGSVSIASRCSAQPCWPALCKGTRQPCGAESRASRHLGSLLRAFLKLTGTISEGHTVPPKSKNSNSYEISYGFDKTNFSKSFFSTGQIRVLSHM